MTERDIRRLLTAYRAGERSEEETVAALAKASYENLGFARVDHSRELRQGFPEVVYAAGKTKEQLLAILQSLAAPSDGSILATRASGEQYAFVHPALPGARYDEAARAIYLRREPPLTAPPQDESHEILIITAGTSDIPVAAEARLTAELYGNRVRTLYDCGVAGIPRLLAQEEIIRRARVIIAIAGMEGALASVVASTAIQRSPKCWLADTSVIVERNSNRQPTNVASGAFMKRKPSSTSVCRPGASRRR